MNVAFVETESGDRYFFAIAEDCPDPEKNAALHAWKNEGKPCPKKDVKDLYVVEILRVDDLERVSY